MNMRARRDIPVVLAFLGTALLLSACAAPTPQPVQEVQVKTADFMFESARTSFEAGKPFRFEITNAGTVPHEWMIMPRGRVEHGGAIAMVAEADLGPGATKSIVVSFKQKGEFEFACHVPGHYEAGMVLPIAVS